MRGAIGLFLTAVVCIAIAWWISMLPGSVTATIAGTTIQTSTPIALLLLAILFVVLYVVIRLIAWVFSIPGRVRRGSSRRTRIKGELALNRALVALAADDAGGARREAGRSRRLLGDTPLTLLISAQAGRLAGREDEAAALYEQLAERPASRLLGLRGLIRIAVEKEDWQRATALAAEAEKAHPNTAWLRDERRHMAQATGDWREALRLASPDSKAALAIAASQRETNPKSALALAKTAFDAEPGLAPAAIAYATALRGVGKQKQAQDVLRQAWSAKPHPDLAAAFVADAGDKMAQAREMAVLIRANPDNPEAFMAIAQAAFDAGLIGEARRQLDRARAAGVNQRRLWSLLAKVDVAEGKAEEAQDALQHMQGADPDPTWRCTACGKSHDQWHATCDNCRSTGTIHWEQAAEATPVVRRRIASPLGAEGLTS
ncbi:MAG: heme biosynthesis HemY N-terminal domain-containing protein [Acetobacteraceae bacterium]|nr:heme biosynthesis HemY N-terminal domain-containing protein [Acetobacteraceae bacterium]